MVAADTWYQAMFSGIWTIIWIAAWILVIVGMWKTFVKAGKPGWGAIIPIYNAYLMIKIAVGRAGG